MAGMAIILSDEDDIALRGFRDDIVFNLVAIEVVVSKVNAKEAG